MSWLFPGGSSGSEPVRRVLAEAGQEAGPESGTGLGHCIPMAWGQGLMGHLSPSEDQEEAKRGDPLGVQDGWA